jgi:transcriptional regulator with PAS, ATPase and Fis domain
MIQETWLRETYAAEMLRRKVLQLGSLLYLRPSCGAAKFLTLNKTKYVWTELGIDYELVLVGGPWMESDEEAFFYLKSLSKENLFLHNGRLVGETFVHVGDKTLLGHAIFEWGKIQHTMTELTTQMIHSQLVVLLEGETGTGKGYLAKKLYEEKKCSGRWVHINLSSLAPSLLESELFGHVKGAFTGAYSDKKGALETAHQGVLFLDEIDSLPYDIQTKLLLFLDGQTFRPVGSNTEKKVCVKLVVATGKPLEQLVDKGLMRKDFYYRIASHFKMQLRPLRASPELIKNAILEMVSKTGHTLSPSLMQFYMNYRWPGNYRQLKEFMHMKMASQSSPYLQYGEQEMALLGVQALDDVLPDYPLQMYKDNFAYRVYQQCEGNFSLAAKKLQVHEKTLRQLVLKFEKV